MGDTFPSAPVHHHHQRFDKDAYAKLKSQLPSPPVTPEKESKSATRFQSVAITAESTPRTPSHNGKENTNQAPIQLPTPPKTPKTEKTSQFPFPEQPVLSKSSKDASEIRVSANLGTSRVVQPKLEQRRGSPAEVRRVSNQSNISDTSTTALFNDEPAPQTPEHVLRPVSIASATPTEFARVINRRYASKPVGLGNIVAPKSSIGFNDTSIAGISAGLGTSEAIQPKPDRPRQPPTEVRRLQYQRNDWDTSTANPFKDGLAPPNSKTISRPISTNTTAAEFASIINRRYSSLPVGPCDVSYIPDWDDDVSEPPKFFHELPRQLPAITAWTSAAIFANGNTLKHYQALDLQRLIKREHGEKVCGTDVSNDVGLLLAYDMG